MWSNAVNRVPPRRDTSAIGTPESLADRMRADLMRSELTMPQRFQAAEILARLLSQWPDGPPRRFLLSCVRDLTDPTLSLVQVVEIAETQWTYGGAA